MSLPQFLNSINIYILYNKYLYPAYATRCRPSIKWQEKPITLYKSNLDQLFVLNHSPYVRKFLYLS